MNFFESITSNPIFPIATFLIGILVRTYFYYKSKKSKTLKYVLKSYNLIKDHTSKFSELNILYKGEEVKNFTVTKMIFWNSGKETIDGKDITNADPLTLAAQEGCRILELTILKANNPASVIKVSENADSKTFTVSFDYLDHLDGAVLNIIHDGTNSNDIRFTGRIKGLKKIVRTSIPKVPETTHTLVPFPIHLNLSKYPPNKRRFHYGMSRVWTGLSIMFFFILSKLLGEYFPDNELFKSQLSWNAYWLFAIPCGLIIASGIYIIRKKIPKGLDIYEDV